MTRQLHRSTGDTPSVVGLLAVTWAYRDNVLELEPHGPLPPEIYRRRRALAIGIAALVVAIVAAIVFMVLRSGSVHRTPEARGTQHITGPARTDAGTRRQDPRCPTGRAESRPDADRDRGRGAAAGAQTG